MISNLPENEQMYLFYPKLWPDTAWYILAIRRKLENKKEGKDQESIQSSTTPDPGYQCESDNFTIKHYKREPRGQLFPNRWPQGINK